MIVYDGVKTDFLANCENDSIAMEIEENKIWRKEVYHVPNNQP